MWLFLCGPDGGGKSRHNFDIRRNRPEATLDVIKYVCNGIAFVGLKEKHKGLGNLGHFLFLFLLLININIIIMLTA